MPTLFLLALLLHPAPAPAEDRAPVLLELFTSQGCSSCPPAEALMAELGASQPLAGLELLPLVFHVDYWDRLGWKDPFASKANTQRQYAYARGEDRVYTPQAIINGGSGLVGHDRAGILKAAQGLPRLSLALEGRTLSIQGLVPEAPLWIAWTRDAGPTRVTRGENAGRKLGAEHTVLSLEALPFKGNRAKTKVASDTAEHLTAFQQAGLGPILSAGRIALKQAR